MESQLDSCLIFEDAIKKDVEIALKLELNNLKAMVNNHSIGSIDAPDKELEGFQKLFAKFLSQDSQENIVWEKIEKLPTDSVSIY